MHMQLLAFSLFLAVLLAMLFVKIVLWLGLKDQLTYVVPLLPVFYAIVYPILENAYSKKNQRADPNYLSVSAPEKKRWSGKLLAILLGVAAGVSAHTALEAAAWLAVNNGRPVNAALVLQWVQGDLIPLSGSWKILFLSLELLVVSVLGGLCVGLASATTPLLNGLLAGVILSMWTGANQFTPLYEAMINWSSKLGTSLKIGWKWYYGLCAGLFLQAFIVAICSEYGYRLKNHLRRSP